MKHLNIKIFGRVQGVGFRFNTRKRANDLDLRGFVRNESDGSVYVEVEGDAKSLEKFTEWCKQGPTFARVKRIEKNKGDIKDFDDFKIKY